MRASIRQVAERAQVSPMTVSRVIKGRKNVNAETYERVLAAVHELNYVPVMSAVQNRAVTTHNIGVVPFHRNPSRNLIDIQTLEGLCEQAHLHSYDLSILLRGETEWMANREDLRFLDRRSDGFIFISLGSGEWQTALETLVEHEIPTVVCYRRDVPEGVVWVDPDNEAIINLALDCLVQYGHKRIAYLGGPNLNFTHTGLLADFSGTRVNFDDEMRQSCFIETVEKMGLDIKNCLIQHTSDRELRLLPDEAAAIFDSGVTGVVCVNDHLALQLWDYAEAAGLKIPQDLSIIGVDDQMMAAHRGLTSIGFGYDAIGRAAVQAWVDLRSGGTVSNCCQVVPVQISERSSVGPPAHRTPAHKS